MASVRIIPPFRARGLYAGTAALAMLLAAFQTGLMQIDAVSHLRADPVSELAVTLGPLMLFVIAFAAISQRRRPVVISALVFGFTHMLTLIITGALAHPFDRGASLLTGAVRPMLFVSAMAAVITALFALLIRWLTRTAVVTLVEQTGRLCTHCGYTIDPTSLLICPECGRAPDFQRLRYPAVHALSNGLRRAGRAAFLLLLAGLIAAATATVATSGRRLDRFRSSVNPDSDARGAPGYIEYTGPDGITRQRWVAGVWKPDPNNPALGVIVAYDPAAALGDPVMQIRAATRTTIGPAAYSMTHLPVVCTLSRAHADHVLANGLPEDLLDAMLTEARTASSPGPPAAIDPAPYFPQ